MSLAPFKIEDRIEIADSEKECWDECYLSQDNLVIHKRLPDENALKEAWRDSVHFVAGNIQARLEELGLDEQYAWNIYLIFEVSVQISVELKNRIESDKFCCKKYVITASQTSSFEETITSILPIFGTVEGTDNSVPENIPNESRILQQIISNMPSSSSPLRSIIENTSNLAQLTTKDQFMTYVTTLISMQNEVANG